MNGNAPQNGNRPRRTGNAPQGTPGGRRPSPEEMRRRQAARKNAERRAAQEKEARRRERKRGRRIFLGRLVVFLVVLALLLVLTAILFWIMFRSTPDADPDSGKIRYYYGGKETRATDVADGLIDGTPFLCFNDLSDYLGMSEGGGADGLKFLIRSDDEDVDSGGTGAEEYVIFLTDEAKANVNGQIVSTDGMNRIVREEVWVSLDFVSEYMRGISVSFDREKLTVQVARVADEEASSEETPVYLPVEFTLKAEKVLEPVPEDPDVGEIVPETKTTAGDASETETVEEEPVEEEPTYELNFVNDLSEYEKYMNPEDRDAYLTLVNTVNLLDESYTPSDLVDCKYTVQGRSTQQLRLYANKALEALMMEMQAAGYYNMAVYSGFRSYSYQKILFAQYTINEMAANTSLTQEEAEKIVLTYSTRPGTSEHQTGLAVDMDTLGTFSTDFEYEPEYEWLSENAWKFGFVLRFPKDKTDITTIQFEPWHYRFVGRYHAKKIHDAGMCLEEYVESLKNAGASY